MTSQTSVFNFLNSNSQPANKDAAKGRTHQQVPVQNLGRGAVICITCQCLSYFILTFPYVLFTCSLKPVTRCKPVEKCSGTSLLYGLTERSTTLMFRVNHLCVQISLFIARRQLFPPLRAVVAKPYDYSVQKLLRGEFLWTNWVQTEWFGSFSYCNLGRTIARP